MNPETVSLLRNPENGELLGLVSEPEAGGGYAEWLVGVDSKRRYPVRDGIPVFVADEEVTGANKKYQALYDRIARWYDLGERLGTLLDRTSQDVVRRDILREVAVNPGERVLEVSIGTGINLRYLPPHAAYFGLDLSMGMLRQCQRSLKRWKRHAELVQGTAERLPFADDAFDVVYHFGGINHFNDKGRAILEMVRVAKPGTRIFVGDETQVLTEQYEHLPFVGDYYRSNEVTVPFGLLPPGMLNPKVEQAWRGKLYVLSFTKP